MKRNKRAPTRDSSQVWRQSSLSRMPFIRAGGPMANIFQALPYTHQQGGGPLQKFSTLSDPESAHPGHQSDQPPPRACLAAEGGTPGQNFTAFPRTHTIWGGKSLQNVWRTAPT